MDTRRAMGHSQAQEEVPHEEAQVAVQEYAAACEVMVYLHNRGPRACRFYLVESLNAPEVMR